MEPCSEICRADKSTIPRYCGPEGRCEPCNELACQRTNIPFQCLCHCVRGNPKAVSYPGGTMCPPTGHVSNLENEDRIDHLERQVYVQWIILCIVLALLVTFIATIVIRMVCKCRYRRKLKKSKRQKKTCLQHKASKDSGIDKSSIELAEIKIELPADNVSKPDMKIQGSIQETKQDKQGDQRPKNTVHKHYFDRENKLNAAEPNETDEMLKCPAKYEDEEDDPGRLREFHAEEAGDGNPTNKPDIHLLNFHSK